MKKVSIIILLTVLLLGAFTACNGDVFSDLMPKDDPEPTPKRIITLEIPDTYWEGVSFDDTEDVKTKVLEIPEDCDTWEEYLAYLAEVTTDIKVYDTYEPDDGYTLQVVGSADNKVYFGNCRYGLKLDDSKSAPPPDSVNASAEIVIGGTYTLTHFST